MAEPGPAWMKISAGLGVWVSPGVRGRGSSDAEEGVRTGLLRASVEGRGVEGYLQWLGKSHPGGPL